MADATTLTMTEAAAAIAAGETTALALTEACLERIAALDPVLNATIRIDADRALGAAAAADRARAAGTPLGPLHGVPMAHKDMYYREGEISTCGSAIRRDFVPGVTATVLERLDAAGAIQLGTLNMAEFAQNPTGHNAHFGHCHNPWDPAYCTGGSSSGSGAAVAGRLVFAALGSDTGGSIRLPAAICGITGLKPTQTRVSRFGAMPLSFSCDNVGPLAQTARDCARFLAVTAGHDARDPTSSHEPVPDYEAALDGDVRGLRIGVVETHFLESADAAVLAGLEAALAVLQARGAVIRRLQVPVMAHVATYGAVVSRVEGATIHAQWMRERPQDYAIHLSARLFGGYAIPATYYLEALSRRGPVLRAFAEQAFAECDIVATPTLRTRVPTLAETDIDADPDNWDSMMDLSRNTRPFNYLGLPTVSVPCGFDDRGLPLGLQLAGRPFAEARVLRVADAFQRDTDWHRRVPPVR